MATGNINAPLPTTVIEAVTRTGVTFNSGTASYAVFRSNNSTLVKDGYTALGILGYSITGTNATLARVYGVYLESSTEARVYLTNTASGTGTYTITILVLYQKN